MTTTKRRPLPGAARLPDEKSLVIEAALATRSPEWTPRTRHRDGREPYFANRLVLETSPYLQQHAHNPVNWFPWGDEAFSEAKRMDKPLFVSVGYSTCHWCHVMEEESFEDLEIAAFLNTHFVAVKVDREERPDIDAIYMAATQALTGRGGWPMSVWMNARAEPFYAGTYFPPRDGVRRGSVGFLTVLSKLDELWKSDREQIDGSARSLTDAVRKQLSGIQTTSKRPDTGFSDDIVRIVDGVYDDENGGLNRAPKFPTNVPVRLLLRAHRRTGNERALRMATHTLEKMAAGGMYDQLAGGFHRYSTDERWLVPHFEKMLYDNALLSVAYTEAYEVTGRSDFARVVREVLEYVEREMTAPEGGFYSATDADSEGAEGLFFVWTPDEIRNALDPEIAKRFMAHYGVTEGGNFEGRSILHVETPSEEEWAALADARRTLLKVRNTRVPPLRDDKVLAAWNGLMISAFAVAARVFNEPRWSLAASRAASFVLERMKVDGRLRRSFKDGVVGPPAFLDDHAFLLAALVDLFETTCDPRWVSEAKTLADELETRFSDATIGGWFMTAADHETLLVREKPTYDGAEPSGGSVATLAFLRLGTLTGDARWFNAGLKALGAYASSAVKQPMGQTELALAVEFLAGPPKELVVAWPNGAESGGELEDALRVTFAPHVVRVVGSEAQVAACASEVAAAADRPAIDQQTTAYVCEQGVCRLPVQTVRELEAILAPAQD